MLGRAVCVRLLQTAEQVVICTIMTLFLLLCNRKLSSGESDTWEFTGEYWKLRHKPGFANYSRLPTLW